jgi:hypothetical protein
LSTDCLVLKKCNGISGQDKPKEKGIHGSRALWDTTDGSEGYWIAFKAFLDL